MQDLNKSKSDHQPEKKPYESPQLVRHGRIEELTNQCAVPAVNPSGPPIGQC